MMELCSAASGRPECLVVLASVLPLLFTFASSKLLVKNFPSTAHPN